MEITTKNLRRYFIGADYIETLVLSKGLTVWSYFVKLKQVQGKIK